jgi:hypothetical protein
MASTPPSKESKKQYRKVLPLRSRDLHLCMGAVGKVDALAIRPANNAILLACARPDCRNFSAVGAPGDILDEASFFDQCLTEDELLAQATHRPLNHPDSPTAQPSDPENESTTTDTTTNLANSLDALARRPVDPPTPRTPPSKPIAALRLVNRP